MDWKDINKEELSDVSTNELKSIRIELYEDIRITSEPNKIPNLREMYLMKKYGGDEIRKEVSVPLDELEMGIREIKRVLNRIDNELCIRKYK